MLPSAYRELLAVPHARRLVLTTLVGRLPIAVAGLALILLVRETAGSFTAAGATAAAYALSTGIAQPLLGRLVDRLGPRPVLTLGALAYAAALGALVAAAELETGTVALAALAAVAGATYPPLSACARTLWSDLLGRRALLDVAFALDTALIEIVFVGGPLLTAALAAFVSPAVALLVAAGAALVGNLAFATSVPARSWRPHATERSRSGALAAAGVRTVVAGALGMGLAFGVLEVAMPALADRTGSAAAGGIPLATMSLGSLVGGLWYGARAWAIPLEQRYLLFSLLFAVGLAPLVAAISLPLAIVLMTVAGVFLAPAVAASYGLIERVAPAGTLTEAYTWVTTATVSGMAGGAALAGVLVEHAGLRPTLLAVTVFAAAGGIVALARRATLEAYSSSSASVGA